MQGTKEQYSGRQNLIFSEYNSFKTRQNKIKLEQSKPEEKTNTKNNRLYGERVG